MSTPCATPCTPDNACSIINSLMEDMDTLWTDYYSEPKSVFIATGNIGIPADADLAGNPTRYANDQIEYMRGASLINSQNPTGLFLIGGNNFDAVQIGSYNLVNQEAKFLSGFNQMMSNREVYPVFGEVDFWPAEDTVGDITAKMANTFTRFFPHLPDAKRYYSVYDSKTKTEFFVLSSGRYRNYYTRNESGFVYPNDILVGDDQYDWFAQRVAATPAKNKVVIFAEPFTSISDVFGGVFSLGSLNVFNYFDTWDFQSFGVNLIINGHSGNSFHLKKSSVHIVNASAFSRSRMGLTYVGVNTEPPYINGTYGVGGYSMEYFSHQLMGIPETNYSIPPGDDLTGLVRSKNEFFRMTATKDNLLCEFVSYDPYAGSADAVRASMIVEHSFDIPN